jgi:hypothetical protein
MHYLTLIEELYQTFYEFAGEAWEEERANETHADDEIKRLIAEIARRMIQVYEQRLSERKLDEERQLEDEDYDN